MSYSTELELARSLIRVKSLTGSESQVMAVMLEGFRALDFDESYLDDAGNAIGVFRRGEGPRVVMNGHLDTVALGDPSLWPYAPLSAELVDGHVWGRGSVDMKSALACMCFAARDAVDRGFTGTIFVTAVVQEEVGGLGSRYLAQNIDADVVILGEPSNLNLMLGHRGRVELEVQFLGKIAHAAKHELGDNALYQAASFLQELQNVSLPSGGPLKGSSVAATKLVSHPGESTNVVPGQADLTLDYRNIPGDEPEDIIARMQALAPSAKIILQEHEAVSENAKVKIRYPHYAKPYLAPGENAYVTLARQSIATSLKAHGLSLEERVWWFATDAPYLGSKGAPVIGFGPGNEELAHTSAERVPVKHLAIARDVYADLALTFAQEQP